MGVFKESVIVAFMASQAWALPAPQAATTTYACNPAHSYPNGQSCVSTNGALSLVSSTKAASATAYACNPAHSYPNGQSCVSTNGALSLVTAAAASSTAYACNPAHSYPNGQSCVSTNGALSLVSSTPAASATAYACNPAHSYPNGQSCVSTNGALSLVSAPAATATAYACNPAHSYPNGQSCVSTNGALSLVTSAPAASTTAYACNPAHSYPNGQSCVSTNGALSLVTPTTAAPAATSAAASSKCPLDLTTGSFEYPHLLEVNGVNGYFGHINTTTNTTVTFDIPASDAGKNCNTYFALPAKGTMETSDYTLSTSDGVKIVVSESKHGKVAEFLPEADHSWPIYSSKCPAGEQIKYEMSATGGMDLSWFQDYNPCALGIFVVVS